jgi:hypothetical protein
MNDQRGNDIPSISTMLDFDANLLLGNGSIVIISYCTFVVLAITFWFIWFRNM